MRFAPSVTNVAILRCLPLNLPRFPLRVAICVLVFRAAFTHAKDAPTATVRLPNGWALSPAGRQMELGGLPLKLLPIPGTSQILVASNGYAAHFIALVDLQTAAVVQR